MSELVPPRDRLELRNIRKAYPAVVANDDISLRVAPGEIHAVVGENGAGKSTLMKIIYGMVQPDAGEMLWNGREVNIGSPAEAQRLGIGMVFQHFALFDTFTVAENIALAMQDEPSIEELSKRIVTVAARYGLALSLADNTLLTADRDGAVGFGMIRFDRTAAFAKKCIAHFDVRCSGPDARAASLSGGNLQKFIIGREILQDPIVLIVSQPTWGVDVGAAMVIRQALLDLRSKGAAILVISEELDELFEIADRIAVIAGGRLTPATPTRLTNRDEIGIAMSGAQARVEAIKQESAHAVAL